MELQNVQETIAFLRERRDKIDSAIAILEDLVGESAAQQPPKTPRSAKTPSRPRGARKEQPGEDTPKRTVMGRIGKAHLREIIEKAGGSVSLAVIQKMLKHEFGREMTVESISMILDSGLSRIWSLDNHGNYYLID